jgi:predicted PurR-regulated permease PerM
MDRKVYFALLAYTATAMFLYVLYLLLEPFLMAIGWSAVIAIATLPVYERMQRLLGGGDTWPPLAMTVLVFLVVIVPSLILMGMLARELVHAQEFVNQFGDVERKAALAKLLANPWVAALVDRANQLITTFNIDAKGALVQGARRLLSFLFGSLTGAAKGAALFVFQLLLGVVILFFLYRDGRKLTDAFWSALPIAQARKDRIHDTVENVVSAVVIGVLATATIQGALAAIGYWFVDLPSPVLLGTLTAIAALVPVVGTLLVWVPAAGYLLATGNIVDGLILAGWCLVVVGSADNFLRPLLISGRTGLPFSLMTLGALGGLAAFGFFGLVVGPLILAVFLIAFEMYRNDLIDLPLLGAAAARTTDSAAKAD